MDRIYDLSRQLNNALLESKEYQRYISAKRALESQPELYQAMNEYRRRNRHIQRYAADDTIFDETNQLLTEFDPVLKNDLVTAFLFTEQQVCRMMQKMYVVIGNGLEFDDSYTEG